MPAEAYILDGYVDEPACLGVPPYISPYIRTVAGALIGHGYTVRYLTIDQSRNDPHHINRLDPADLLVMIAGVTVPGKYLGGTPATLNEIEQVGHMLRGPKKLIGGPIGFGYSRRAGSGRSGRLSAVLTSCSLVSRRLRLITILAVMNRRHARLHPYRSVEYCRQRDY